MIEKVFSRDICDAVFHCWFCMRMSEKPINMAQ